MSAAPRSLVGRRLHPSSPPFTIVPSAAQLADKVRRHLLVCFAMDTVLMQTHLKPITPRCRVDIDGTTHTQTFTPTGTCTSQSDASECYKDAYFFNKLLYPELGMEARQDKTLIDGGYTLW